ncbi:unnamed protein product [Rotaria sp. Silwood1]|nr:unnamed protein product [Rotaria sp. Silwood1]
MDELERSLNESKDRCESRGQVLSQENIENAIRFANKHRLFILADEVYQENVYLPDSKFVSFKKVLMSLRAPYNQLELASFHSASKGWYGECGSRCGYYKLINIDKDVKVQLNILQSARPCVTSWGQACYGSNSSFHSASKGWYGECGSRCGYYELINIDKDVKVQLNILQSARPCVTSWGQACYGSNCEFS